MKPYTHFAGAGIASALLYPKLGILPASAIMLGGVLPDIDIRHKHRGWMHTLLGALILSVPFFALDVYIGIGLLIGYFIHLLLDILNPSGIMLLFPLSRKRYRLARIRTGSFYELIFFSLLLLALFFIMG